MIYIFTEAGGAAGFGHFSRCSALYDECVTQGLPVMLVVHAFDDMSYYLEGRSAILVDWRDIEFLQNLLYPEDHAIVDSYLAPIESYSAISALCQKAVYIDDTLRLSYPRGVVVNPSLYGDKMPYPESEGLVHLGGAEYVMVRSAFSAPIEREPINGNKSILITMGGSDTLHLSAPILSAICNQLPSVRKAVVLGSETGSIEQVKKAADRNTEILVSLDAVQMREVMLQADCAITAAGQTIYELLQCGTPMVPIMVVENQVWNVRGLNALGIAHIDALCKDFDCSSLDWGILLNNAPLLAPFVFEGQKKILELLT